MSISATVPSADSQIEEPEVNDSEGLLMKLKSFCHKMAAKEFWIFVTARKRELGLFRSELPKALADCVDPPRFVLEAISEVFLVAASNNSYNLGWACVLLLESLIPVPKLVVSLGLEIQES
ncbi:hypothetical protein OROMI_034873 [Orobanche minor]